MGYGFWIVFIILIVIILIFLWNRRRKNWKATIKIVEFLALIFTFKYHHCHWNSFIFSSCFFNDNVLIKTICKHDAQKKE
jgi:hypothetical protein